MHLKESIRVIVQRCQRNPKRRFINSITPPPDENWYRTASEIVPANLCSLSAYNLHYSCTFNDSSSIADRRTFPELAFVIPLLFRY